MNRSPIYSTRKLSNFRNQKTGHKKPASADTQFIAPFYSPKSLPEQLRGGRQNSDATQRNIMLLKDISWSPTKHFRLNGQ